MYLLVMALYTVGAHLATPSLWVLLPGLAPSLSVPMRLKKYAHLCENRESMTHLAHFVESRGVALHLRKFSCKNNYIH